MKLLLVHASSLEHAVRPLGEATGDHRQLQCARLHVVALVAKRAADGVDDLGDGVRARVGDPVALAGGLPAELGAYDAVDEVVDVHHRATLLAMTEDREAAPTHEAEERGLARWLQRPVEPGRAHDHRVEAAPDTFEHRHLAL